MSATGFGGNGNFAGYWQQFADLNNELNSPNYSPSSPPPHLQLTYDTIGQIIPRTIGHCRVGLKTIWVQGQGDGGDISGAIKGNSVISLTVAANATDTSFTTDYLPPWVDAALDAGEQVYLTYPGPAAASGDAPPSIQNQIISTSASDTVLTLQSAVGSDLVIGQHVAISTAAGGTGAPTMTFAAALCNPIDPLELGNITAIYDGATGIYSLDGGGFILPPDWSDVNAAQLQDALNNSLVYPGTEAQTPAPLIVADRGASQTNAFRGLRYIIIPNYPIVGSGDTSLPRLSIIWRRSNILPRPPLPPSSSNATAVTFAAGAG